MLKKDFATCLTLSFLSAVVIFQVTVLHLVKFGPTFSNNVWSLVLSRPLGGRIQGNSNLKLIPTFKDTCIKRENMKFLLLDWNPPLDISSTQVHLNQCKELHYLLNCGASCYSRWPLLKQLPFQFHPTSSIIVESNVLLSHTVSQFALVEYS